MHTGYSLSNYFRGVYFFREVYLTVLIATIIGSVADKVSSSG